MDIRKEVCSRDRIDKRKRPCGEGGGLLGGLEGQCLKGGGGMIGLGFRNRVGGIGKLLPWGRYRGGSGERPVFTSRTW